MYYMRLPRFDNSKIKMQNVLRYNEYEDIIMNSFVSLTKLNVGNNAPYVVWARLISCGELGVCEDGTIGYLVRTGEIDINGEMSKIEYVLGLDGKQHTGKCLPLYMLPSKTPFTTFTRFAEQLSQVDISQKVLVKQTRKTRICNAIDENQKKQIEVAYEKSKDGENVVICRDGIAKLTDNETSYIDLFDPAQMSSMQFLSSYHSELCRRLYGLFGFSMQGKDKQAQVNSDELEDREQPSLIYIRLILDTMNECIEKVNKEFGFEWSIKPSKIIAKMLNEVEKEDCTSVDSKKEVEKSLVRKEGENNADDV